jgi:hypothetical protein
VSSNINLKDGIYDPTRRFAFTNITKEPFTFTWGKQPITVKAGETVELRHHLAVLATNRLVDKIMSEEAKADEDKVRLEKHDPFWRSPKGIAMGVPAAREPYESKVLKELPKKSDTDAQLQVIRTEITSELTKDLNQEQTPPIDGGVLAGQLRAELPVESGTAPVAFEGINLPIK